MIQSLIEVEMAVSESSPLIYKRYIDTVLKDISLHLANALIRQVYPSICTFYSCSTIFKISICNPSLIALLIVFCCYANSKEMVCSSLLHLLLRNAQFIVSIHV